MIYEGIDRRSIDFLGVGVEDILRPGIIFNCIISFRSSFTINEKDHLYFLIIRFFRCVGDFFDG